MRKFADALPASISYIEKTGGKLRYRMVNRVYEDWFGIRAEEISGRPIEEVLGPAFHTIEPHLEAALRGAPQEFELRVQTREGERIVSVQHVPDHDADGRVVGVIVHGHDVTERHRTQEALRSSEERLRLALSAANGVGTWDWDVAHDTVRTDAVFAPLYGVDIARAAAGASIDEFKKFIHPDDLESVGKLIEKAIATGEEYQAEYRVQPPDGGERWLSARGRCSYAADGSPLRFPGVTIDITARKQSEDAMIRSEKLAAVGRLASSIAHEINNPLESVVNLLYLIECTVLTDATEARRYAQLAQHEIGRVSQIATQTLGFFKQTTGATEANVAALIGSVLALYQGRLANSGVVVEREIDANITMRCYEGELRQVLNNLVGNAIDAMRLGGRLVVKARRTRDASGTAGVRITVADTGQGMSSETLHRLYEPFFTTKGISGTGLGLWVSLGIVRKHEGTLRVWSSQNERHHGTVFTLFVPAAES